MYVEVLLIFIMGFSLSSRQHLWHLLHSIVVRQTAIYFRTKPQMAITYLYILAITKSLHIKMRRALNHFSMGGHSVCIPASRKQWHTWMMHTKCIPYTRWANVWPRSAYWDRTIQRTKTCSYVRSYTRLRYTNTRMYLYGDCVCMLMGIAWNTDKQGVAFLYSIHFILFTYAQYTTTMSCSHVSPLSLPCRVYGNPANSTVSSTFHTLATAHIYKRTPS